jgi:hypothetical protein
MGKIIISEENRITKVRTNLSAIFLVSNSENPKTTR